MQKYKLDINHYLLKFGRICKQIMGKNK